MKHYELIKMVRLTLTVRWLDSNWWCLLIKQSYLYKIRVNLHYYGNQIACMCTESSAAQ